MEEILGNTMNTGRTVTKRTNFFIKFNIFLSFTIVRFIEILGNGSYVRRRIAINFIRD